MMLDDLVVIFMHFVLLASSCNDTYDLSLKLYYCKKLMVQMWNGSFESVDVFLFVNFLPAKDRSV